jgi:hypothetical protein
LKPLPSELRRDNQIYPPEGLMVSPTYRAPGGDHAAIRRNLSSFGDRQAVFVALMQPLTVLAQE